MNKQHILRFFINIVFILSVSPIWSQEQAESVDTTRVKEVYGIRLGVDIIRPILQVTQKEAIGMEVTADYRVANKWFVASELGYESEPSDEDYIKFHTKGSYAKLGFNYNLYENWEGMNNEVYVGLRYGFSTFQQQLDAYTALDFDDYFGTYTATPGTVFEGLTAHWAELHFGLKVEAFPNLFLTTSIQFKKLIKEEVPEGFVNLYIPGFTKVLLNNAGIGFNYTIAYLIPIKKK